MPEQFTGHQGDPEQLSARQGGKVPLDNLRDEIERLENAAAWRKLEQAERCVRALVDTLDHQNALLLSALGQIDALAADIEALKNNQGGWVPADMLESIKRAAIERGPADG